MKRSIVTLALLGAMLIPVFSAFAAARQRWTMVFQLGKFDRSSYGFAGGQPARLVDFVVGQSSTAKDWYASQPAVLGSSLSSGTRKPSIAPRSIVFQLQRRPEQSYQLRISVLIESACVPVLLVDINGRRGRAFLEPRLDFSNGDQSDSHYPADSHADLDLSFPGRWLRKGKNTISLQVVNYSSQEVPGARLTYDAIALEANAAHKAQAMPAPRIAPTIFYRRVDGQILEQVNVYIPHDRMAKAGETVTLSLGSRRYLTKIAQNEQFGIERVEFMVSPFPRQTVAVLRWKMGGRSYRASQEVTPQKQWTLFLVPEIHLDMGYSDYLAKVSAVQTHAIDEALHFMKENPNFRFSLDGEWPFRQFLKTRSRAQVKRAVSELQAKRLFIPADYANLLTGFGSAEVLIRSLYPSANLSRKYHTPFNYASITDVPSYSWSYASILASAGIRYLVGGSNNFRAPVLLQGRLNEDSPFWWEGPDGQKVLLWYSRQYQHMEKFFGLPPVLSAGRQTIPLFMQMYEHPGYHASATILYGTQQENTDLFPQQATLAGQWNHVYAYPHIIYSGFHHALHAIQEQFGPNIPTIKGSGGPYWEDGIASDAYYAAMERRTEGRAPIATDLSALTSIVNPRLKPDRKDVNQMWRDMVLMDEHTWDSGNSVWQPTSREAIGQAYHKNQYAVQAAQLATSIAKQSLAEIVQSIPIPLNDLVVFNSLNWKRSGRVSIDLSDGDQIVDPSTGRDVPYRVLREGHNFQYVRFIARNVPAVGYKVYAIKRGNSHMDSRNARAKGARTLVMENRYYRIVLDPQTGAVKSIFDEQLDKEIVNQHSAYKFGQYLYVTGGDKTPNTIQAYSPVYPVPKLRIHGAANGRLVSVKHLPYGEVATMRSSDTNTPSITSRVILFNRQKKIEFVESLVKKKVYTKEGVYFAFPFAMSHPTFQYEIQDGVVNPSTDMYPGAGHEWFSVQHWVSVEQKGMSATVMPLDAGLVTLGDINRGKWPTKFGVRAGTIFSYVMNNYWNTNYKAGQGGHFTFHYVITSAPSTNPVRLSRLGWDEVTPLIVDRVRLQDKAIRSREHNGRAVYPDAAQEVKVLHIRHPLNALHESFLQVTNPHLVLLSWEGAQNGSGTILQFLNLAASPESTTVKLPVTSISSIWQTNVVEKNLHQVPIAHLHSFHFNVRPHGIVSFRVLGKRSTEASN